MFASRLRTAWRQQSQAFRRFSTEELPPRPQPKTPFQKVINFIGNNKQQLLNVIAVYFVFSFSVHNFRMQEAWKEQEKVVGDLKEENARLKDGFDDIWYQEAEAELKTSKNIAQSLHDLIAKAHNNTRVTSDTKTGTTTKTTAKKEADLEEFAALASAVSASTPASAKGKMF